MSIFKSMAPVIVAASVLLAGCAGMTHAVKPSQRALKPEEGGLVLSLTGNTGLVSQANTIGLRRVDGKGGDINLEQVTRGLARDTTLFAALLPEGEYELTGLNFGSYSLGIPTAGRQGIGRIKIVAGHVCDFGRLIATNTDELRAVVGRSRYSVSNRTLITQFTRAESSIYSLPANGDCSLVIDPKDNVELFAMSRPVGAMSLIETANGDLVVPSRMGTLLIKRNGGAWHPARSGSLEALMWAAPRDARSGRMVVVGEFNTLLELSANERFHRMDTGNLPAGNLVFVNGNDAQGWVVALQTADSVGIYRSASLENQDWSLLKRIPVGAAFWTQSLRFWAWPTSQGFGYAATSEGIHYYDRATQQWSAATVPGDADIYGVSAAPGDVLAILTAPRGSMGGGLFTHSYLTHDYGKSWFENKPPFSVQLSVPTRTAQGTVLELSGVTGERSLYVRDSQSGQWTQIMDGLHTSSQLIATPTQGVFNLVNGNSYTILQRSLDEGRSWSVDFDNRHWNAWPASSLPGANTQGL